MEAARQDLSIRMKPSVVFCIAVITATLIGILLALFLPVALKSSSKNHPRPWLVFQCAASSGTTGVRQRVHFSSNTYRSTCKHFLGCWNFEEHEGFLWKVLHIKHSM